MGPIVFYSLLPDAVVSAIWIETQLACYTLKVPSAQYRRHYCHLYLPVRVAQIIITSANSFPGQTYEEFLHSFLGSVDNIIGRPFEENDIYLAVCVFDYY